MRIRALTAALFLTIASFGAEVPRKAPEFVLNMPEGGHKLLSQYRGKVIALEFLYTTCPHCQHASVMMNQLLKEYGPRGFQPIGVAFNPMSKMLVPDYVKQFQVTFPIAFAEREPVHAFLEHDPNEALHVPQLVFIDRKGMIRQQSLPRNDGNTASEANVRKMIELLLAEPAAGSSKAKPAKATKPAASKAKAS